MEETTTKIDLFYYDTNFYSIINSLILLVWKNLIFKILLIQILFKILLKIDKNLNFSNKYWFR